jgi:transposase-like protein
MTLGTGDRSQVTPALKCGGAGKLAPTRTACINLSLNASVRKAIRNKGHFPNDQAATKLIWLALRYITENWKSPPITWHSARAQPAIQFGERFTLTD